MSCGSAIDIPAVAYVYNKHFSRFVVYLVNCPVVAHSDPPPIPASQLAASRWARIIREGLKTFLDAVLSVFREPSYSFLRSPLYDYGLAHQPPVTFPSLISRMACCRGMASSPSLSISNFASS